MAGFNIDEFMAIVEDKGIQRNNKFLVHLDVPQGLRNHPNSARFNATANQLRFWCEAVQMPGVELMTHDVRRYGYGPQEKMPSGVAFNSQGATISIIPDQDYDNWFFFQQWIQMIVNFDTRDGLDSATGRIGAMEALPYEIAYKEQYVIPIVIQTFDDAGRANKTVTLRDAYPVFLQEIDLAWADQNNFASFKVAFNYIDWYMTFKSATGPINEQG